MYPVSLKSFQRAVGLGVLVLGFSSPCLSGAELGGDADAQIDYSQARAEATQAIQKFRIADGFEAELFAYEPQLVNPVAFCLDEQGRIYVSETGRYRSSALDIRHYMDWYMDDLACRTVDDRVAMIRKYLGRDYRRLATESERIRLLEDRDGDGLADFSQIYADGFTNVLDGIASGVLARKGSVYFTNIPNLWKLRDADGDGVADERQSLSYGYGVRFSLTGHDLHGMKFGPDGKLYFTVGDRGADVVTAEGKRLSYPDEGVCFRCNPDGTELEVFARGLRNPQELAFNEYGDLFTGENDCDHGDLERWVHIVEGSDSGWRVGYQFSEQNPGGVWNAEGLWHLRYPGQAAYLLPPLAHIDNGPSGLVYYPGTGLPKEYDGHFFLCHFKGLDTVSGIKMFQTTQKGASYSVGEMKELIWNVMPTDVDFGPDGNIYLTDWVEGWPKSERGRIYRLHHKNTRRSAIVRDTQRKLAEGFDHHSEQGLAGMLAHPDMRVRQEAQFEFADRGRISVRPLLNVLRTSDHQLARIHAIWGLSQIAHRNELLLPVLSYLTDFLTDADSEIRAQTAKALGGGYQPSVVSQRLVPLLKDANLRVRFHAAMSLGKLRQAESIGPIMEMIRENNDRDLHLRHAGVMALAWIGDRNGTLEFASDPSNAVRMAIVLACRQWRDERVGQFLKDAEPTVAVEAARAINDVPINPAMPALAAALRGFEPEAFRSELAHEANLVTPMVRRMINANYREGGADHAETLIEFASAAKFAAALRAEALMRLGEWSNPSERDQIVGVYRPILGSRGQNVARLLLPRVDALIADEEPRVAEQAIDTVGRLGIREKANAMLELVSDIAAETPLRTAALNALSRMKSDLLSEALKTAQNDFAVDLRKEATRLQANMDPSVAAPQLNAVLENGSIGEQQVALATLAGLGGSVADEIILRWFGKVADGTIPAALSLDALDAAERRADARIVEGLAKWRAALEDDGLGELKVVLAGGDPVMGRRIVTENPVASCTRCHRLGETGSDVGPRLDGIGARLSPEQLAEAIVYPNRSIAEGFETVVLTLKDESVQAGILKEETETELVLHGADTGVLRVPKTEVASRETGLSGMPEGMGELLSRHDLRDVIAFLSSLK